MFERTLLSREDIFSDGDPLTRSIYDFRREAAHYVESTIARATVDLNRSPDDLPPKNPDGVVKSHTVTGKGIYRQDRIPGKKSLALLLRKYYQPYHNRLEIRSKQPRLFCGLDCHTMLDRAPATSKHPGEQRPFICLSNRGDRFGNRIKGQRLTCPPEMLRSLAVFLKEQFPSEANNISLNDPFLGGYIIRRHSRNLPWIQVELNRRAYLDKQWFDPEDLSVCRLRINELRKKMLAGIADFVRYNHLPRHANMQEAA
jgi:formiminoglutamase